MGASLPKPTARLVVIVVLPTPPLGDMTAMIRPFLGCPSTELPSPRRRPAAARLARSSKLADGVHIRTGLAADP